MVIIFSEKYKVFLEQAFESERDPLGGEKGIRISVMQRYVAVAGIPVTGTRKMVKAFSTESGQPIPVLMWTETMKRKANEMLPQVRGAWKRRLPMQVILLALFFFIISLYFLASSNQSSANYQEQYRNYPQQGDIVLATETISYNKTEVEHTYSIIVFKIEDIRRDSLIIRRGTQKEDIMQQYRIKNKEKLVELFDLSDSAFSAEVEVYSFQKYREGDERLRRIIKDYTLREDIERQDSILSYTDIIEPMYIKRINK